ncbi:hypothetical protein RD792_015244 [Penstemon davidsonii]|uniref:Vacuolar protein 14 C-terminal Fig4-binding domain-containing protein n=1 Tax=Penstemon davidsonii TaxID=160366 RepID=A0ABR0CRI9_9LAMI|nr:hypothetical protein RD792_015244 [Penstemon davidsonii]
MADALSVIPAAVLRNLSDKLYEKRKNAALDVEGIVKQLTVAGDHDKITAVINLLTNEYTNSPQANHRKGGLIGLAAATVGLTSEAAQHLDQIVPPVLNSFSDQDSRVRYYACEALYNIAKVVRGDFIVFFNQIFDALCKLSADSDANVQSAAHLLDRLVKDIVTESDQFSIEEFIPLLRERMNVLNPYVRQFLVGWITVLDSVPDIDMLGFLPDFLDGQSSYMILIESNVVLADTYSHISYEIAGLFNMLSDSSHEIRQQADSALSEFLQEIKNSPSVDYGRMAEILVQRAASLDEFTRLTAITWIYEFVKLGGDQLVPYYADILGAILPCISDKEEKIRVVARETNEELRGIQAKPSDGFDVGAILSVARRHLSSEWEATRIESLHWISTLLSRHRTETYQHASSVIQSLVEEDINVKFLVQLDKLIHLLETPTFAYLRLQLLEPGRYIWLLKALYGLLMLLPQQSIAFKILRTRLKTVPSYSFSGEQFKRMSSGNAFSEVNFFGGSQVSEDGDVSEDQRNMHNGINFASRLQQFEQAQRQHRVHSKSQAQSRLSSTSSAKEVQIPEEPKRPLPMPDMNRPPSSLSNYIGVDYTHLEVLVWSFDGGFGSIHWMLNHGEEMKKSKEVIGSSDHFHCPKSKVYSILDLALLIMKFTSTKWENKKVEGNW